MENSKKGLFFMLAFMLIIISISFISAEVNEYAPVKQGDCVTIKQVCSSCSYVNVNIAYPNSSIAVLNQSMTSQGAGMWAYDFCNTSELGRYDVTGEGDISGTPTGFDVLWFDVSYTGYKLDGPQTTMYLVILAFIIGLLGYLIYIYPTLPKHKTNESGYVIDVAQLSYLRPIVLGIMWILIMAITYIVANIAVAYIVAGFLGKFIFGIWTLMMYSNFIILPLWIIYIINDFYKSIKLKEFLERGGMAFE